MDFLRIKQPHPYLTKIEVWYEESFPADERRRFDDLLKLLPCPDMHLCALVTEGQLVGFMIYWQWDAVLFVEHFAIDPAQRGKQLGQQALEQVKRIKNSSIILLEVELPTDDISYRRIQFYERQGFSLNEYAYSQPPYKRGNSAIPMKLMSIPAIATQHDFDRLSGLIKERVYERFY